jgi:hypothetical protein
MYAGTKVRTVRTAPRTRIRRPRSAEQALAAEGGRAVHDAGLGGFHGECHGGQTVGDEVQPQQLQCELCGGHADDGCQDHDRHFGDVATEDVADELADVVEDHPVDAHGRDDAGEVVVLEHHVGGVLGDIGAGDAHGHADVGRVVAPGRR